MKYALKRQEPEVIPILTQLDLDRNVEGVLNAFVVLKEACPHKDLTDCGHPKQEFNCMLCAICNCPLLL